MKKIITLLTILMLVVFMVGCEQSVNPIQSQIQNDNDGKSLAKKGGGGKGGKEIVIYSVEITPMPGTPLENNLYNYCLGTETLTSGGYYNIIWARESTCVNVTPIKDGNYSATLYDDPQLYVRVKKGKITGVYFFEQDHIGQDGIQHSTNTIELDSPVTPDAIGFTIPVRRDDIEVWKHKTHNGGARVEMVGTICIGDIVYTPITP